MDRYYPLTLAIPAGTAAVAPVTQAITLEDASLVDVELVIPPGHSGLTGVRVRMSNQQVLPWGSGSWIVADDYRRVFEVNSEIGRRTVSVQAYNTDIFPHTFDLRFHIRDLTSNVDAGTPIGGTPNPGDIIPPGSGIGDLPDFPNLPPLPDLPPFPDLPLPPFFPLPGDEQPTGARLRQQLLSSNDG